MLVCVNIMVFNGTFNNISVISWWSVLLVEVLGLYLWCLMPLLTIFKLYHGRLNHE
jgi:hypothetical protein